jgi:iron complex outermembrane receptor protein
MKKCNLLGYFFLLSSFSIHAEQQSSIIPPVTIARVKQTYFTDSGALKNIISREQIMTSGATTLAQLLQNSGLVQVRSMSGDSQVDLGLRGFGANASSNSLLLINGIPITNPDLMPPNLNVIPVADIEYISIIPGSESVLYGDQAVGGVVAINTLHTLNKSTNILCTSGSYNAYTCNFLMSNQSNWLGYYFNVGVNHTDNYRDHNNFDQQAFSGQFNYKNSDNALAFSYQLDNEYIEFPGALSAAQVRQNRRQATNNTDFFRDANTSFHLIHKRRLNNIWQVETDLSRRQMAGHGTLFSPFTQSRLTYFVKPTLNGNWDSHDLIAGADYQSDDYNLTSTFGLNNNKQQKSSLFSLATFKLRYHTQLHIGARGAEQTSRINSVNENNFINRAFATNIGFSYQPNKTITAYIRRAGSYRFPKADENASTANGIDGLRTQRGIAYETGLKLHRNKYTSSLNIYQLNLRDEIAFDPTQTPQQPFGSNQNLAPTQRRGMSVSGQYQLLDTLSADGQFNLVHAIFNNGINQNNRIPLVSEMILHAGVDYHIADNWHLYSEAIFTGNQFAANDNANIAGAIGGFTTYNMNLGYDRKNIRVAVRVNNIFNKPYYVYSVYQPSMATESFYPAPERNFMVSVTWYQV